MKTPKILRPTITVSATPDYSSGDVINTGPIALSGVNSLSGYPTKLVSLTVKDASGQAPSFAVLFFRDNPTGGTYTDNAAFSWGTGDFALLSAAVKVNNADYVTVNSKSICTYGKLDVDLDTAGTMYILLVATATWNAAAATDLSIEFGFES